jgi:hypothetical protein
MFPKHIKNALYDVKYDEMEVVRDVEFFSLTSFPSGVEIALRCISCVIDINSSICAKTTA